MSAKNSNCKHGLGYGLLVSFVAMTIAGCGGGGGSGSGGGGGVGGSGSGTPAPSPAPAPGPTPAPGPAVAVPSIVTQPAPVTVADGDIAQFTINAAGDAPLTYQWRRNGVDLANGGGVTGATTATVNLTAPYPYNTSQMSVRVSNAAGNVVSGIALLTVTPVAPTIATQPANTTVNAGLAVTLSATITGGTAPLTYQWKRNGKVATGATSATISIGSAALGDNAAMFVLDITNPAGTFSTQAAMLTVLPDETSTVFTVDTTDDLVDGDIADGKCLTVENNCSLRAAIMQADASKDFLTDISVPAGIYKLTRQPSGNLDGSNGNLNLSAPVFPRYSIYIIGAGAERTIIDGNEIDNVLDVTGGRVATLAGLTLRNGRSVTNESGGIIANIGSSLTILDCVIENGHASSGGGGILNTGSLSIYRSTIRANSADYGGGLFSMGTTRLRDSTISGNQAINGGGIYNKSITYVVNSTVSTNTALTDGGGIYSAAGSLGSPVTTGIYSSSIVGNDADHDRDQLGGNGGGVFIAANSRFISNFSLLARNTLLDSPQYNDCHGNMVESGINLLGEANDCTFSGSQAPFKVAIETVDPALKDNGGTTFTHATTENAVAFLNLICVDETGAPITTDQRGAPRGADCDIGAYEFGAVAP